MSAWVGVLALDGSAILSERLASAQAESGGRSQAEWNLWAGRQVALASRDPVLEGLEGGSPDLLHRCVLAGDVRLDNRDELSDWLALEGGDPIRHQDDSTLLLALYRRYGVECLSRLTGDFAFAIWDPDRASLLCARDPLGVRQLTYSIDGQQLWFATRAAAVAVARRGAVRPRRELLRDLLFKRYERWVNQTAFAEVSRLPAGHYLVAHGGKVSVTRYWPSPEGGTQGRRNRRDHSEQFRELLDGAVSARLRGCDSAGLLLSGGLDSSSIACLAERMAATGGPLSAYTAIYPRSPAADERDHLRTVVAHCSTLRSTTLNGDECPLAADIVGQPEWLPDEPLIDTGSPLLRALLCLAREDGCKVVLAGNGADQALLGEAYYASGLVRDIAWSRLGEELSHFGRRSPFPRWKLWAAATVGRFLPDPWFHQLSGTAILGSRDGGGTRETPRLASRSARIIWRELFGGLAAARSAALDQLAHDEGVEWRFPFLDSRVVRFCLELPAGLHFESGFDKALLRRAMLGTLPESIRTRTRPAHFSEPLQRRLTVLNRAKVWAELCETLVIRYGLLSASEWETFESPRGGGSVGEFDFRRFLLLLATATWLRQGEARFGSRWS